MHCPPRGFVSGGGRSGFVIACPEASYLGARGSMKPAQGLRIWERHIWDEARPEASYLGATRNDHYYLEECTNTEQKCSV